MNEDVVSMCYKLQPPSPEACPELSELSLTLAVIEPMHELSPFLHMLVTPRSESQLVQPLYSIRTGLDIAALEAGGVATASFPHLQLQSESTLNDPLKTGTSLLGPCRWMPRTLS